MLWITLIKSVSVISKSTSESFILIMLLLLLLICACVKFLSTTSIFTISVKVLLNILHILLGLETISFPSCRCILQVNLLLGEPLSLFTNFHSTLEVLFELVIIF
jgi:hypothetical protein